MAKTTRLERDTRKIAGKVQKATEALALITFRHDDPDLTMAIGKLADAILFLNGAANKFERRGTDYDKPAAIPDIVGFLNGSGPANGRQL